MHDHDKSKAQLLAELKELRHQVEKLQGSENRYQALFKYSIDGVLLTTPEGDILYANPAACDLLGYSEAELQAGGRKLVVDLADPRLPDLLGEREETGRFNGELTLVRRGGAKIEVEISSVSFTTNDGSIQTTMLFRDVTSRKQVSQALRESEERFRAIVTSMDDFIFTLNNDSRFTGVFGNFLDNLNVDDEYFLGRTIGEVLGENPSVDYKSLYKRVFAGEKVVFESNYIINGETVYFQTALAPLVGNNGDELYGVVGVGRDITELKQAEGALRESEAKLRALFDLLPVGVSVWNSDQKLEEINESLERILSIERKRLFQGEYWDRKLLRPDGSPMEMKEFAKVRSAEENRPIHNVETGVVLENGEVVWTEVSAAPLPDNRMVVVTTDVTERRKAADALRESETKYKTLFDLIPVGVSVIDSERNLLEFNQSLERILSLDSESVASGGYAKRQFLRPDGTVRPFEEFASTRAVNENRPIYNVESGVVLENGKTIWVEVNAIPIPDDRVVLVTTDITDRKEREKEILEDQRLRSLGLLAGGIAHDINNFLTPIKMNLDMLRIIRPDDNRGNDYLNLAENATRKIEAIVQEMLVFSGRRKPQLGTMDLNSLISGLLTLLHASLPKSSRIQLDLTSSQLPMQGDRAQLEQVLMNLILNASEALEGQTGQIKVSTRRQSSGSEGERAVLVVQDSGSGILPENVNHIFDPFFTTKTTGRGLGLSAVRGIIQSHDGEIEVVSKVGEGTTFTIVLPLFPTGFRPVPAVESRPEIVDPLEGKWLVVEDEEILRNSTTKAIRAMGVETVEAEDGVEGLLMVEKYGATLTGVLLDITMPNMNGQEVFNRLRESYPDLPVILMSGYSQIELRDLLAQPKVAFLSKPFRFNELREAMISVVNQVSDG